MLGIKLFNKIVVVWFVLLCFRFRNLRNGRIIVGTAEPSTRMIKNWAPVHRLNHKQALLVKRPN